MLSGSECAVLNQQAAINHQMKQDAAQTVYERIRARKRISGRSLSRAARQKNLVIAVNGVMLGAMLEGIIVLVTLALI